MTARAAGLIAMALVGMLVVACGGGSDDPSSDSGVPEGVYQAIDDQIRNSGLTGASTGVALVADCADAGAAEAFCIDGEESTVLDDEATVRVYLNVSEVRWDVSLLRRASGWVVANVALVPE